MSGPIIQGSLTGNITLTGRKVRLRPKGLDDAPEDYQWRRDPELCQLDAAEPITMPFEEYLKYCAFTPAFYANSNYFGIDTIEGKHIGNCSYFNIDEVNCETEIGIMIGDKEYWNQGYGTDSVLTLLKHLFSTTNLNRIYLKTLDWNQRAQQCFAKCGFRTTSMLKIKNYNFIVMDLLRPAISQAIHKPGASNKTSKL